MLILAFLWLLFPLMLIAFGAAGLFALAIIVQGFMGMFGGDD